MALDTLLTNRLSRSIDTKTQNIKYNYNKSIKTYQALAIPVIYSTSNKDVYE